MKLTNYAVRSLGYIADSLERMAKDARANSAGNGKGMVQVEAYTLESNARSLRAAVAAATGETKELRLKITVELYDDSNYSAVATRSAEINNLGTTNGKSGDLGDMADTAGAMAKAFVKQLGASVEARSVLANVEAELAKLMADFEAAEAAETAKVTVE